MRILLVVSRLSIEGFQTRTHKQLQISCPQPTIIQDWSYLLSSFGTMPAKLSPCLNAESTKYAIFKMGDPCPGDF